MHESAAEAEVVPADQTSWSDIQAILTGAAGRCQCQRQRLGDRDWYAAPVEQRRAILRSEVGCDEPATERTIGVVAYLDGEPAGWCAVDSRSAFRRLRGSPVPWAGRDESKDDSDVWAIACLVVRSGFRGRGLTYALVRGAVEYARSQGARAIEGYPLLTHGAPIIWDELNVGPVGPFVSAGFREVSHPTKRRVVMRLDLDADPLAEG